MKTKTSGKEIFIKDMIDFVKDIFNYDLCSSGQGSACGAQCCLNAEIHAWHAARVLPLNRKRASRIKEVNKLTDPNLKPVELSAHTSSGYYSRVPSDSFGNVESSSTEMWNLLSNPTSWEFAKFPQCDTPPPVALSPPLVTPPSSALVAQPSPPPLPVVAQPSLPPLPVAAQPLLAPSPLPPQPPSPKVLPFTASVKMLLSPSPPPPKLTLPPSPLVTPPSPPQPLPSPLPSPTPSKIVAVQPFTSLVTTLPSPSLPPPIMTLPSPPPPPVVTLPAKPPSLLPMVSQPPTTLLPPFLLQLPPLVAPSSVMALPTSQSVVTLPMRPGGSSIPQVGKKKKQSKFRKFMSSAMRLLWGCIRYSSCSTSSGRVDTTDAHPKQAQEMSQKTSITRKLISL